MALMYASKTKNANSVLKMYQKTTSRQYGNLLPFQQTAPTAFTAPRHYLYILTSVTDKPDAKVEKQPRKIKRRNSQSLECHFPQETNPRTFSSVIAASHWHCATDIQRETTNIPLLALNILKPGKISTIWIVSETYLKAIGNSSSSQNYILIHSILGTFRCWLCAIITHHRHLRMYHWS